MADSWRWRLSGNREMLLDDVAETFDCNRAQAVEQALRFTQRMAGEPSPFLERALQHPDMTPELAEVLDTPEVTVTLEIEKHRALGPE